MLRFPLFIQLKQFPETTTTLQKSAIIGKILYGTSQIKNNAKYVDPPPKPTLEYNIDVMRKKIDNMIILKKNL